MKDICILGMGYIGLPTACMFAKTGFNVHGVDIKDHVVQKLRNGDIHIEEPGLEDLLQEVIKTGKLHFDLEPIEADAYIICVPTPLKPEKTAELKYVRNATESIVNYLKEGSLVILESTVPPGTCKEVVLPILETSGMKVGEKIFLSFCPERVIPGRILIEIVENDRIVGGIDDKSTNRAKKLYSSFVKGNILTTNSTTAEMVKLMENTYRDVNIALANEFALIAGTLGIDIWQAIQLANRHPRVNIHSPGPGVGGHCIPIVPWFIVEKNKERTPLIQKARQINDMMPSEIISILEDFTNLDNNPVITIWGVAFKPNTDDASFSPATEIIRNIQLKGGQVKIHDPFVKEYEFPLVSLEESVKHSECILIIANHDYYEEINPEKVGKDMNHKNIIDTRNSIDLDHWVSAGFKAIIFGDAKTY